MTTNNPVNVNLSGQTGTVHFVGSTSPTFITPTLGAALATSIQFNNNNGLLDQNSNLVLEVLATTTATDHIQVVNGSTAAPFIALNMVGTDSNIACTIVTKGTSGVNIKGTGLNDSATAGYVGEYISSVILTGSAVSLVNATAKTITSITLTPGDWDITANMITKPASGTTTTSINAGISLTNNTFGTLGSDAEPTTAIQGIATPATVTDALPVSTARMTVSVNTTVYLIASVTFAVSTMAAFGYIAARRRR
jgi:hypothetical protein